MNLYLPIEILNREFQSKILVAMESASKGIKVYLGRLVPYLLRGHFAPGVIMQKSITPSPARLEELKYYKKNNFIITSLDEEVGLINSNNKYLKLRYSNKSLELSDKIFTWGKFDYNNLSKKFKKHKEKFILSGNPRLDLWKNEFDFFFKNKKLEYKNYILFSFNFSLLSKKDFDDFLIFLKKSNYINRGFTFEYAIKERKHSFKMFEEYSKLIASLSKQTNLKIIVRPHPTEKLKNYNFLKKYSNVEVIKDGSLSEWIYYADLVIHSGCTGGLEASIRGRPTISFCPFESIHGHKYADSYSKKTKNLEECLSAIKKILNKKDNFKKKNMKNFKLRAQNFLSKKPSYKVIAHEFLKSLKENKIKNQNNDLILKFKFKIRDLRSKVFNLNYGNTKFTYFNKKETLNTFKSLKKINPKYKNLSIDFIKKDIIQIKKR